MPEKEPRSLDSAVRLILLCIVILFAGVFWYVHQVTVSREAVIVTPQPTKYKNNIYAVNLEFPTDWQPTSDSTFNSYAGTDGFFVLSVSDAKDTTISALAQKDVSDIAHPYGSAPTVSSLIVDGESAVIITPSSDQDPSLEGRSELIVAYPNPVIISGDTYNYLILQADKDHIQAIARSLTFIN